MARPFDSGTGIRRTEGSPVATGTDPHVGASFAQISPDIFGDSPDDTAKHLNYNITQPNNPDDIIYETTS